MSGNGCRPPVTPWEPRGRTESTARDEQTMGGNYNQNGPRKNEYLKNQYELAMTQFIFIGGSSMPWWNWEVIQRKSWKIIQCLVKNRRTRVLTTFEQGQPTKFIKQTSDRSCIAIIFFDKTGSTTLNTFKLLDIFGHIRSHAAAAYSKWGRTKDR